MTAAEGGVAARWNRFWFAGIDARPYGLLRIAVALAGLQLWAGTLPLLSEFYVDAGQFALADARAWSSEWGARFLMPDALGSLPAVAALFALWGGALGALLVGWRTRPAAWASWVLTVWFLFRNPTFANGGDEVLRLVTLYLAAGFTGLRPEERAYSLDRRRALRDDPHRAAEPARMPAWPLRLVQVQVCVVYLVAGFWKVVGPAWWDGSALWWALENGSFSRFGAPDLPWLRAPFAAFTIAIAWWEMLFPLLVARERTRRAALLFGVLVHGLILVTMNIGVFPFVMLAVYPVFLRPAEAAWIVDLGRTAARRVAQVLPGSRESRKAAASAASP